MRTQGRSQKDAFRKVLKPFLERLPSVKPGSTIAVLFAFVLSLTLTFLVSAPLLGRHLARARQSFISRHRLHHPQTTAAAPNNPGPALTPQNKSVKAVDPSGPKDQQPQQRRMSWREVQKERQRKKAQELALALQRAPPDVFTVYRNFNSTEDRLHARLAFLFLTKGPLPMAPLWERFFKGYDGEYSTYVQPVRPFSEESKKKLPEILRQNVLPVYPAYWGMMSVVQAERYLLRAALKDPSNTHFILVSDSCIPLWPLPYVRHYLTAHRLSYIEASPKPNNMTFGIYTPGVFGKWLPLDKFRKGSQWFALRREHAQLVVNDKKHFEMHRVNCKVLLKRRMKRCCADEYYVQSLLNVRVPGQLAHFPVTYSDWRGQKVMYKFVAHWTVKNKKPPPRQAAVPAQAPAQGQVHAQEQGQGQGQGQTGNATSLSLSRARLLIEKGMDAQRMAEDEESNTSPAKRRLLGVGILEEDYERRERGIGGTAAGLSSSVEAASGSAVWGSVSGSGAGASEEAQKSTELSFRRKVAEKRREGLRPPSLLQTSAFSGAQGGFTQQERRAKAKAGGSMRRVLQAASANKSSSSHAPGRVLSTMERMERAHIGSTWRGALHPIDFTDKNVNAALINKIKAETNFRKLRPFVGGRLIYREVDERLVPDSEKTLEQGYCRINGIRIHCFLFARKFRLSALPFLLEHSAELLGY